MQIIRVADGDDIYFCAADADGAITRLNQRPEDPQDYLALAAQAGPGGVVARARELAARGARLPWSLADLDVPAGPGRPRLLIPYVPPEAWGAAFTYPRPGANDPYARDRQAERPVIFFKATPRCCVGPNEPIGSRSDATAMIPEPELAVVLDSSGAIIGYTGANDVSSRDLPQASPLYVCYSKTFTNCLSLGPAVVPPEALPDSTHLDIHCRVTRNGTVLWDSTGNTGNMLRRFEDLARHLTACNDVPAGTLLATGTAISPPADLHIIEGDHVEINIPGIGRLANSVINV
jgi:2-dehydro-3-deoxy-D-arabinonate dehydratase